MREAMAHAEVGDDVYGEDPTVNMLQDKAAALFGKQAALFLPTGTMANLVAVLAQTHPGDTIILSEDSHPFNYESGNLGMVAGVMTHTTPGQHGILSPKHISERIRLSDDHHISPTTLVSIENTSNRGGGTIYPIETVAAIGKLARERGIRLHCDGARIFNAVVETNVSPAEYAAPVDTLSFCLSKGLGCPAGSLLVGDRDVIDRAHRFRKMLGGGMRQAGILAAAGLYALDHNVNRLREDHLRAADLLNKLTALDGVHFPAPAPTNMLYIQVEKAPALRDALAERGVLVNATAANMLRAVTHMDIHDEDVDYVVEAFRQAFEALQESRKDDAIIK
jgi:threonine aldolase